MTTPPEEPRRAPAAGIRSLQSESFSVADAVGGWRGLVESVAPGFVFVVVFIATGELVPTLIAALAVTAVAVVVRLVTRTPVTYALGGVLGIVVGAFWAWRSGEAGNYYLPGLLTNAGFALAIVISLVARYPLVGLVVGALGIDRSQQRAEGTVLDLSWRKDADALRRYTLATWLWLGAFVLRLAVQVPLYLADSVGWLGTARLVMGLPLWALVLWLTWLLVRGREEPEEQQQA